MDSVARDRDAKRRGDIEHLGIICTMILVVIGAAALAIARVERSPEPLYRSISDWSPLGYTYSLALFAFPLIALTIWFMRNPLRHKGHWRAFWLTVGVFGVVWSAVDIFLANLIFSFPNPAAHIPPMFWGYRAGEGFTHSIPYEEFAFYFGAVSVILLLYRWSCDVWFGRYSLAPDEYERLAKTAGPLVTFHRRTLYWAAAALVVGVGYKMLWPHPYRGEVPIYFLVLWIAAVVPTALLTRCLAPFINDRALLFTILAVVLVSLLWEVTLALPNGWWDYRPEHMLGLFIEPWFRLPIEQILLWPVSGWSNLLIFELFQVYVYSERPFLELLFGRRVAS